MVNDSYDGLHEAVVCEELADHARSTLRQGILMNVQ